MGNSERIKAASEEIADIAAYANRRNMQLFAQQVESILNRHFGESAPEQKCCLGSVAASQGAQGFGDDLHCVRHDEWSRGADRDDEKIEGGDAAVFELQRKSRREMDDVQRGGTAHPANAPQQSVDTNAEQGGEWGVLDAAMRLPRCQHGKALRDGAGEALEPPCGCRAADAPQEQTCAPECGTILMVRVPPQRYEKPMGTCWLPKDHAGEHNFNRPMASVITSTDGVNRNSVAVPVESSVLPSKSEPSGG